MAPPNPTAPLPAAVSGERFEFASRAGRLSAYVAGDGPPLLLLHGVNTAASVAEVRPLHEHFAARRTVFSLDLPGYGHSERSDRAYTARLMTNAVQDMVQHIRQLCGPAPMDALATSLSCEFLARAAVESPVLYRSVALVSPTGFSGRPGGRDEPGGTRALPRLYRSLCGPRRAWGGALFRGLTRPGVIRYVLQRTWGGKHIDEALWQYAVLTARQPGAEHAPLCFLAGGLFSADILRVYEQLQMPVWMSHGVRGDFTDYRGKALVERKPSWRISVYATGALPHFEVAEAFFADYAAFLSDPTGVTLPTIPSRVTEPEAPAT
ncbi:MAG: hypothetical protein RJA10_62 [Pseudomonadota bacterium]|jgi:pimeloyl-ACP methyl ester carboxylesterase